MSYFGTFLRQLQAHCDDDLIDRLNYYYTGTVLILFGVLVSAKQYVGYPIQCWIPAHFTEAMEQYTENYCWVQNTWWIQLPEDIPPEHYQREENQLVYYQWVPFILAFQAVLFYMPCFFWRQLNWQSGINIEDIVQMARDARSISDAKSRSRAVSSVAQYVEGAIMCHRPEINSKTKEVDAIVVLKDQKNLIYVSTLYLLVKLCYCLNVVFQYWLLNFFLGSNKVWFGPELLSSLIHGEKGHQWQKSGLFPRVTLCDFEVKVMGNLHRHTIQCVLMINMFNEKIFLFLWFWFAFLLLVTFCSLVFWSIELMMATRRKLAIEKRLRNGYGLYLQQTCQDELDRFVLERLKVDGVFVLRLIGHHAGDIILTEIIYTLWQNYRTDQAGHGRAEEISGVDESEKIRLSPLTESTESETGSPNPATRASGLKKNYSGPFRGLKDEQDTGLHTKRMGDNAWATAGSRVFRKQILAPVPIYRQHKLVRNEMSKGTYM